MNQRFSISLACLVLAGCQSLYQHDDEPFDRFKAIEGVNTPVFQQKGHEQENFYDYDKRVEAYLEQRLKPAYDASGGLYFQNELSLQEKIKESSPREIMPICKSDERPLGILMFHGLFKDSRDLYQVAAHIHAKRPCTWIRMPLMMGHGSVPGDTLFINAIEDWYEPSKRLYDDFVNEPGVQSVALAGFSTGTLLATHIAQNAKKNNEVMPSSLVLMALPLRMQNEYKFQIVQWLQYLKPYMGQGKDDYPWVYDSATYSVITEFNALRQAVLANNQSLDVPTLLFWVQDDDVIDIYKTTNQACTMFSSLNATIYHTNDIPTLNDCDEKYVSLVPEKVSESIQSYSHSSMVNPLDDAWYDDDVYFCDGDMIDIYGNTNGMACHEIKSFTKSGTMDVENAMIHLLKNPHFDEMIDEMVDHLNAV